jgi:ABC-2 type transport system permease protein
VSAALAIAAREWRALFASALGWSLLALSAALFAWWFLAGIQGYLDAAARLAAGGAMPGVTDLVVAPFLAQVAAALVYLAPLAAMRTVCGERREGTLPLLYSAGAGDAAIVIGKFLGVLGFVAVLLLLAAAMPLTLLAGTALDLGKLAAALLGLLLLAIALSALGVLASAFAQHPATAALAAGAGAVLLWIADSAARARGETDGLINYLALPGHLTAFMRGVVASVDVVYFVLLAVVCLALATRRVARLREVA